MSIPIFLKLYNLDIGLYKIHLLPRLSFVFKTLLFSFHNRKEITTGLPQKSQILETMADIQHEVGVAQGDVHHRNKSAFLTEIASPDGQTKTISLVEMNDADAQLAAQFGYKPVFKREFGYLSTFSFAVSISGLFATVMTTFSYPLYAGGSSAAVWCWLISGAGCMCIAVSLNLFQPKPSC